MNRYNPIIMPHPYNNGDDFLETLRSYIKFSFAMLFFLVLLLLLFWNWQPWFKLEIKPVDKLPNATTEKTEGQGNARRDFDTSLQSNLSLVDHVVRPGETLSEIAEYYGVGISVLMRHNGIDNPNLLRPGQRLEIPQRRNKQLKIGS